MIADALASRVETIFLRVVELAEDDRPSYLDDACAGDITIRAQVESLLRRGNESISTAQLKQAAGLTLLTTAAETLPIQLDRYDLEARLGEGSFGVVYRAVQHTPVRRAVAVKVLKPGLNSDEIVRRFEAERQALAALDHPNIARLLDAGNMPDGRPYFVMELLEARPITELCDNETMGLPERLEVFLEVCAGVEHAHGRAILHRDLKPSNILAARREDRNFVKVIDFGIARALEDRGNQLVTDPGRPLGTPVYMSPEQMLGEHRRVDTRSDVYSLGVVLYELLCGRLPIERKHLRSASPLEMRRLVCDVLPPLPSSAIAPGAAAARKLSEADLAASLRKELEWIAMRAISKDPGERYRSVAQLADDIRNYLAGRPLLAGPDSRLYRAGKWSHRHRRALAGAALLTVVSTLGTAQYFRGVHREQQRTLGALNEAQRQRRSADAINEFLGGMLSSVDPAMARGEQVRVLDVLDRAAGNVGSRFAQQPEVEMSLRRVIGDTYLALGKPDRAIEHIDAALTIGSRFAQADKEVVAQLETSRVRVILALGKPRDAVAAARASLARFDPPPFELQSAFAEALLADGKYADADLLIKKVLATQPAESVRREARILLDANHARCIRELGMQYVALPLFEVAADHAKRALGPDHPQTIQICADYASLLATVGRYAEAEPLLRDALDRAHKILGDDHPRTLSIGAALAQLIKANGRFEQAKQLIEQLILQHKTRFTNDHPDAISYAATRAALLQSLGRFEEAGELFRDVIERCRRVLGDDHPVTLETRSGYAWLLIESFHAEDARPLIKEILPRLRQQLGDDHPETLAALNNYALSLDFVTQADEVETCFKEVIERAPHLMKWDHPQISGVYNNYGNLVQMQPNRKEEALALQIKSLEARARIFGADSLDAAQSHNNVALALLALRRFSEAETHARKSWEDRQRQLGSDHMYTLNSLKTLALAVDELNRIDEAEKMHRQIVETRRRTFGPDHDLTLHGEVDLASVLARMRRTEESVALFRHVYSVYEKQLAVDNPRMQLVASRLAACLDRIGETSQSDEVRRKYSIPREPTTKSASQPATKQAEG